MLHCAPRPVSERRGANQRSPFRKLPFMARAATAPPYKTRQRDAQPLPRLRPPVSTGFSPSPLFRLRRSTPPPGKDPGRPGAQIRAGPSPSPGGRRPSLLPRGKRLGARSEAYALVPGPAALPCWRVSLVLPNTQGGRGPLFQWLVRSLGSRVGGRGGGGLTGLGGGWGQGRDCACSCVCACALGSGAGTRARVERPAGRGGVAGARKRLRTLIRGAGSCGCGLRAASRLILNGAGAGQSAWLPAGRCGAASNQRLPFMVIMQPAWLPLSPIWARVGAPWRPEGVARRKWAGRGRPHPT